VTHTVLCKVLAYQRAESNGIALFNAGQLLVQVQYTVSIYPVRLGLTLTFTPLLSLLGNPTKQSLTVSRSLL